MHKTPACFDKTPAVLYETPAQVPTIAAKMAPGSCYFFWNAAITQKTPTFSQIYHWLFIWDVGIIQKGAGFLQI